MEEREKFRKWLIYILRGYEEYYITYMQEQFDEASRYANKLDGKKNNQIREFGYSSEEVEEELNSVFGYIAALYSQKTKAKNMMLDINDDDSLEVIAAKLRNLCEINEILNGKNELFEDEEPVYVNELKLAREKGLQEELKLLKRKKKEFITINDIIKKRNSEGFGIEPNDALFLKGSMMYKFKSTKNKGLNESKIMNHQRKVKRQQDELEKEGFDIGYDTLTNGALVYKLKRARRNGPKEVLNFIRQN